MCNYLSIHNFVCILMCMGIRPKIYPLSFNCGWYPKFCRLKIRVFVFDPLSCGGWRSRPHSFIVIPRKHWRGPITKSFASSRNEDIIDSAGAMARQLLSDQLRLRLRGMWRFVNLSIQTVYEEFLFQDPIWPQESTFHMGRGDTFESHVQNT